MTIIEETTTALAPEVNERLEALKQRRAAAATDSRPAVASSSPTKKRRHPARKTRIAVLALSLASTAGLAGTFAATDGPTSSVAVGTGGIVNAGIQVASAAPTTVNGDVFVNKWGPVQVQATFGSSGELVAVDAVQVPFADGKSVRINNQAVPVLNNEAISTQSAQVDSVSGATYTSVDYEKSLQSAVDAARAGGITVQI